MGVHQSWSPKVVTNGRYQRRSMSMSMGMALGPNHADIATANDDNSANRGLQVGMTECIADLMALLTACRCNEVLGRDAMPPIGRRRKRPWQLSYSLRWVALQAHAPKGEAMQRGCRGRESSSLARLFVAHVALCRWCGSSPLWGEVG